MRRLQGRAAEAERLLLEVIAAEPNAHAWLNLGAIRSSRGDAAGAIDAFRAAIRLDPRHAEAHCALGGALMERGDLDEALALLQRGHELGSARPDWRQPSAEWVAECEARIARRQERDH